MVSSASIVVSNDPLTTKKKKSSGRKKIDIKKIEKSNHLQVTFSKRRTGLFKKASELCVLTGAQVAIFVNSPAGRMYVFGHPDVDSLIEISHLQEINNVSLPLLPENKYFNQSYEEVLNEFDAGQSEMIESAGSNESDDEFFRGFDAEKTWNEMIMSTGSNESGSNDVLGVEELLRESDAGNTPNEMIVSSPSEMIVSCGGNDDRLGFDECIDGMITSTRSNESGSNDHDVIGLEELLSESDAGIVSSGGKDDGLGWFDECIDGMGVEELENSLSKLQQAKYNVS